MNESELATYHLKVQAKEIAEMSARTEPFEYVENAKLNADKFGLSQVEVLEGALFEPVRDARFDIIAIDPPYTSKTPTNKTEICFWDEDNKATRQFFEEYNQHLNPGGQAYLAWADFSSMELIKELARVNQTSLELIQPGNTPSGRATFLVNKLVEIL